MRQPHLTVHALAHIRQLGARNSSQFSVVIVSLDVPESLFHDYILALANVLHGILISSLSICEILTFALFEIMANFVNFELQSICLLVVPLEQQFFLLFKPLCNALRFFNELLILNHIGLLFNFFSLTKLFLSHKGPLYGSHVEHTLGEFWHSIQLKVKFQFELLKFLNVTLGHRIAQLLNISVEIHESGVPEFGQLIHFHTMLHVEMHSLCML
mmetsp:Transcript_1484/g.5065  ORF Transcript_1484/g.5065 Transcript_1484/m.5065 type:complete len:214 (+) Transcript_1484:1456-2097(+)